MTELGVSVVGIWEEHRQRSRKEFVYPIRAEEEALRGRGKDAGKRSQSASRRPQEWQLPSMARAELWEERRRGVFMGVPQVTQAL